MSTIKTNAILDASGGNTTTINGTTPTAYNTMGKNRIINGAMEIDQRNAGASVSVGTATAVYTLDRWRIFHDTAITSNITAQQSSTVPTTGYIYSQKLTNGTGTSPVASDFNVIQQRIEGYNVSDLNYGSATAATITLSFWVRSSLTGTFGIGVNNSAQNRSAAYTYTINSADTWEQKTITISGDTSGTWLTTSGIGLIVNWDLGSGTSSNAASTDTWQAGRVLRTSACTNFIGTSGATFYITGVQLEVGSVATEFERRPYGTELALCQRYYFQMGTTASYEHYGIGVVQSGGTTTIINMPVSMRASPTLSYDGALTNFRIYDGSAIANPTSFVTDSAGLTTFSVFNATSGLTTGRASRIFRIGTNTATIKFSAEL